MQEPNRVLITGATGAIGPQVVQAFQTAGYKVQILTRHTPKPGLLPANVDIHIGDITKQGTIDRAVQGCELVIHLAALLHIINPSPELHSEYERVNITGTANLAKSAVTAGVKRVIYASTINVYGESHGQIITEAISPLPTTIYARTKLAGEKLLLDTQNSRGEPLSVILRLGAVYGSRIKGNYQQLLKLLARNRLVPVGCGKNRRTLTHDKDVAQAILLAAQHPQAIGQIFNISDGNYHTVQSIIEAMSNALGRRPPRYSLPVLPMRYAAGLLEDVGHMVGYQSPIARATIDKYTEDIAVSSKRIQEELGFKPQYDLHTGWQETVRELRRTGEI
jgi:nucleoside-diphosphate-sugar epimerase